MSFSLTEDQTLLKDAADGFFANKAPVSAFRHLRDTKSTHDPALWEDIGAMGFAGALISEDHGGTDMGLRAMTLVLEAQAKTLGASPLFQTGLVAATALALFGTDAQKAEYLPKAASGELTFAFALDEGAHHAPTKIATIATKSASGWMVTGAKKFVADGASADILLTLAKIDGGLGLFLIASDADGLTKTSLSTVDARNVANLDLVDVAGEILGDGPIALEALEKLLDIARIGTCAEMLGLINASFEMTHDYLKTRTQFGQLIGSFQALQHRASAMLVEIELTRSCVLDAITVLESGKDAREAVSLAKAHAGDTLHLVTNEMIQMHGGIGMTDAHDSGFYIKRARVLETQYGSSAYHRDRWASLNGY